VSSLPDAPHTFKLIDDLKAAAADLTARQAQAEQTLRREMARQAHRHETATAETETRLAERRRSALAGFQSRLSRLEARFAQRNARILNAHRRSRDNADERIEEDEGRVKYQVQKGQLDTERNQTRQLADNDAAHAAFKASLAGLQEAFLALEEDAFQAFRGYASLRRHLEEEEGEVSTAEAGQDHTQLFASMETLHGQVAQELAQFRKLPAAALFRMMPFGVLATLLILLHATVAPARFYLKFEAVSLGAAGASAGVLLAILFLIYAAGKGRAAPRARAIASQLARARSLHDLCLEKAEEHHRRTAEQISHDAGVRMTEWSQAWDQAVAEAEARRQSWPELMEEKANHATERNEEHYRRRRQEVEAERDDALKRMEQEDGAERARLRQAHETAVRDLDTTHQTALRSLEATWQERTGPIIEALTAAQREADTAFPHWSLEACAAWTPPKSLTPVVPFGRLHIDWEAFLPELPAALRARLAGTNPLEPPLCLSYPGQGSILFETSGQGGEEAAGALNNIILRLLSKAPPGRLNFTIIDPVKLGQNFAGIMHLADHEETLINHRIWTQAAEIEQRLADLNEQMEKVIQMYLRNEYRTITEYNEKAGSIAEKFHFLVVADFPVNFSETAIRRLLNIAASGARCGVHTLLHWDRRQDLPTAAVLDDLRRNSICLVRPGNRFVVEGHAAPGLTLELDAPPAPDAATAFLNRVGSASIDSSRVEVPFEQVAPEGEAAVWSLQTTDELRVPIGRTGATKLQYLALGKGTRQHALVAGKTGSGKSTLFHVIITNLSLWCSPEQVEFYLVDFKKGVEFKCYATARLPHARVIAIESDREFGLSVLQRVDEELRRRGDLFRELGVQDVAGYKRTGHPEAMPRSLLLIDEFQELFVEDDRISQEAAVLLDRIVRQGRAFGIHVVLGSQTLGGAYTLARTTIGQMVVRVALQCNEADAYLIMDDNNPAPRLLSRPGEGIYNDMAGQIEGNSPFQAVWLSDEERDRRLAGVRAHAERVAATVANPFVFEGNAPADVKENIALQELLATPSAQRPDAARIWLGSPNRIKGPTEAVFRRQAGNHLLLVGQREEAVLSIFSTALMALDRQHPAGQVRLILLDSTAPGTRRSQHLDRLAGRLNHSLERIRVGDMGSVLEELGAELRRRTEDASAASEPPVFLFVLGLQLFKKLRHEEDFGFSMEETEASGPKPGAVFQELITGGSTVGLHVVASCDTFNNVNRFLGRKGLGEFEMRVLFQMSANDSASLIDSPRAGSLGLHRALFYNEHEGYLETFRPYALPSWA